MRFAGLVPAWLAFAVAGRSTIKKARVAECHASHFALVGLGRRCLAGGHPAEAGQLFYRSADSLVPPAGSA